MNSEAHWTGRLLGKAVQEMTSDRDGELAILNTASDDPLAELHSWTLVPFRPEVIPVPSRASGTPSATAMRPLVTSGANARVMSVAS